MTWTPKNVAIAAAVAVVALYLIKRQAAETIAEVGQAVNPINQDNIFNRGAESLYSAVTGSDGTPGTDLADWVNSPDRWWSSDSGQGVDG